MQGNPLRGAAYLLRGLDMLRRPALLPFVLVPLAVNIAIFAGLLGWSIGYVDALLEQWMTHLPEWLGFLEWLLWLVIGLTLALATGYLFTALALLIASPFNGLLAEKAEELHTGHSVAGLEGFAAALADIPRCVLRELRKLLYYLPMALLVLVLSLIPVVNAFAPLYWFLLGAWMMSIQFVDYPVDNHRLGFHQVRRAVRHRRLSSLGFGALVAIAAGIPVINFFVVPAAVVGATMLWCDELSEAPRR